MRCRRCLYPLCFNSIIYASAESIALTKGLFLHRYVKTPPYYRNCRSVAVGKSTTARLLQHLLSKLFPRKRPIDYD